MDCKELREECEYMNMLCYRDVKVDSYECVKCLMQTAQDCNCIAEQIIDGYIRTRDKVMEWAKEKEKEI